MSVHDTDKIESLKLIVDEQRRDYEFLNHIYDRTRATESVLLSAAYAILVYLYYSVPPGNNISILQRLSVPSEDYGLVIYVLAACFFFFGLIRITLTVFGGIPWMTAYETTKERYGETELETLRYYKQRYDICQEFNARHYSQRKRSLNFLFYCILLSAIILILIKTLQ